MTHYSKMKTLHVYKINIYIYTHAYIYIYVYPHLGCLDVNWKVHGLKVVAELPP